MESRFDVRAVSRKGAEGIAQFMPKTAVFRGVANPFDPISSLENAARYLGVHESQQCFRKLRPDNQWSA